MRKHLISLQSFSIVGAFGAWLLGCPVWSEEAMGPDTTIPVTDAGGVDSGTVDSGPRACTSSTMCPGGYCDTATGRCTATQTCSSTAGCPTGQYCETSRGACVPGCSTNAQCIAVTVGLVCDTNSRRCVPGGGCTTNAQCSGSTPVCLGGTCQPDANRCTFDYQCTGSGQACVDGQCIVTGCTAANVATVCAAGQVCTSGRCTYPTNNNDCGGRCTSAQLCVSGTCLATCTADAQCGSGNVCLGGVCRVDTRPRPFCTMDSQCNSGSVCNNGACRRLCPMPGVGTDGACLTVDVQFDRCAAPDAMGRSLCTSSNEQNPQCMRSADCTAGLTCVNARCQ